MYDLKVLAYLGLVILSIVFVLSTLVGTIVWSVNATVLKPYHSINYLNESGMYAGIGTILRDTFTKNLNGQPSDNANNDSNLDTNNQDKNQQAIEQKVKESQQQIENTLKTAINDTLTDSYIATKLSTLQTSLWDFLTDKGGLSLVIATPELQEAAIQAINANDQLTNDVKEELAKNIKEQIPASFDLNEMLNKEDSANSTTESKNPINFEQIKSIYQNIKLATLGLYAFVIILLILSILITLYLKNTRRWIGTILIIPGILVLALGVGVNVIASQIKMPDLPSELIDSISKLLNTVTREISTQFIVLGIILIVMSILIYISKWILSLFQKTTEPA